MGNWSCVAFLDDGRGIVCEREIARSLLTLFLKGNCFGTLNDRKFVTK